MDEANPYMRTFEGEKWHYEDIYKALEDKPDLWGKEICIQLKALDLFEKFRTSGTPHGLPYTFRDKDGSRGW